MINIINETLYLTLCLHSKFFHDEKSNSTESRRAFAKLKYCFHVYFNQLNSQQEKFFSFKLNK
jgi:hypothetical protein